MVKMIQCFSDRFYRVGPIGEDNSHPFKLMNKSKYYPYLDGLRGIAVILVLLYHLKPDIFKSGFLGVDIFFVLSGYLITGIVKKKVDANAFDFWNFYYRRLKRLLPCLVTTLVFVLVLSLFILTPAELTEFSKTSVYSLLSVSNIYFYLSRRPKVNIALIR